MTIQEAIKHSQDFGKFPEVFPLDWGYDLKKLESRPDIFIDSPPQIRKVIDFSIFIW